MTQCISEPMSRDKIRKNAKLIRMIDGSENELFFDIVKFLEIKLPSIYPKFNLIVVPKSVLGESHGITFPDRDEIQIREDVYERAINGSGRDRLTMAHELGHLLMHEKRNISYARMDGKYDVVYRNPEWQATAFGGELLIPHDLTQDLSVEEIMESCKVSRSAAMYQKSKK